MTADPRPTTPSIGTSRKTASVAGQVVAVIGIGVCIVLAIVVLLARGWAVDQVDSIATSIDDALARGIPALQAADDRVTQMGSTVQEVSDAATAVATSEAVVAPAAAQALSTRLSSLSERYTPIRAAYADAHSHLVSALDRVQTITRFLPGVTVPQAPIDALVGVDEAIRAVDERITAILEANRVGTAIRGRRPAGGRCRASSPDRARQRVDPVHRRRDTPQRGTGRRDEQVGPRQHDHHDRGAARARAARLHRRAARGAAALLDRNEHESQTDRVAPRVPDRMQGQRPGPSRDRAPERSLDRAKGSFAFASSYCTSLMTPFSFRWATLASSSAVDTLAAACPAASARPSSGRRWR